MLTTVEIDCYIQLLTEQGKKSKRLGKTLILPSTIYYLVTNRKFEDAIQSEQLKGLKLQDFDYILMPGNIKDEDHWALFVIDIKHKTIEVYDSNMKEYPDVRKIINDFMAFQWYRQKFRIYNYKVPMLKLIFDA